MPISDIYYSTNTTSGVGVTLSTTTATCVGGLLPTTTKRIWVVGCRVEITSSLASAGGSVIFQLERTTTTVNNTSASATSTAAPQDGAAPAALTTSYKALTGWTTPPVYASGNFLAEWTIPQTGGSAWEEFPPLGYEWGIPVSASATGGANSGVYLWATLGQASSTVIVADLIWSE
jgi:hypothetical protein